MLAIIGPHIDICLIDMKVRQFFSNTWVTTQVQGQSLSHMQLLLVPIAYYTISFQIILFK